MHPILTTRARLGLYLLAWLPIAGLLAAVLNASGGLALPEAAAVILPACLFFAGLCLAPWYSCRVLPPAPGVFRRLLPAHSAAAVVSSLFLVSAAQGLALVLSQIPAFAGLNQRFSPHLPVVFAMGVLLYLMMVGVYYVILAEQQSREAERREQEAHILAREAELRALKAQVNPHFLFNCLHSISALATSDGPRAREMCVRLSDFLRATLRLGERDAVALAEELELARGYLAIEQIRFGERLRLEEEIDAECGSCRLPPLLLQPLVENAIKHGIAGLLEGGWVRIEARRREGFLQLAVENPFDPGSAAPPRSGLGLALVQRRLSARHGASARLDVRILDHRYRVELSLPCESKALSRA
ncbi:MAG TPA: histidine kinase [Bryobacteraceae bacterium]|nr:histidine kinase [Bryobacteraceae bacterium]